MRRSYSHIFMLTGTIAMALSLTACRTIDLSALPSTKKVDEYVALFNQADNELYKQVVPNEQAAQFLKENIPLFECPDKELEKTYYFRWWTFRKHLKETPEGYVITEFLPSVPWAGKYNTINCSVMHHFREGRWLHDSKFLTDYARFWVTPEASPRSYSCALADAIWNFYLIHRDEELIRDIYEKLQENFSTWEETHRDSTGLFWQNDDRDAMEMSVGGTYSPDQTGYRPTINSYMYADAIALSKMARLLGKKDDVEYYKEKAAEIKKLTDEWLWDNKDEFYKIIPRHADMSLAPCREEIGYIPFAYGLPDEDKLVAWEQLFDEKGFKAPYGPTTCEQRAEGFRLSYEGHECQWNGPSWPYATSQTLTGMIASLNRFGEKVLTKERFMEVLQTYSNSHRLNGQCWIDENLNPYTGDWISRTRLMTWENGTWCEGKGGVERGKDYNHSTFNDIIISGLVGLQVSDKGDISFHPLVPDELWPYYCLRNIRVCGKNVTVVYDKDGKHYGVGKGLKVIYEP